MNRTFIVEDCAEDDFGQRTTDEVTGEQRHIDFVRSCFWIWNDYEYAWQSRPFKGRQVKRRKGKGKGKGKGRSKRTGRAFFGDEQAQDPEWWSEETLLGCSKERLGRKACQKAMVAFRRVVFSITSQMKAQARIFPRTKARGKTQKEKARKELILNPDFQPVKHPMKKDTVCLGIGRLVFQPLA